MIVTLENNILSLSVNTVGAELWEIVDKRDGTSRLWDGDPAIWAKRSPTLFPIIGMVKNGKAQINGKTYSMEKHGILRYAEFSVKEQTEQSVTFVLAADTSTKECYPFDFTLCITYTLDGASVKVDWDVTNNGETDMPFQMGGHPAFRIPLVEGEGFEDYRLIFEEEEDLVSLRIDGRGEVREDVTVLGKGVSSLPLRYAYFDDDALIFKGLRSYSFSLVSGVSSKGVRMNVKGIPYLGIWTMKGVCAPYVCLEPWYGVNSRQTDDEVFLKKEALEIAVPGETWHGGYSFELF